MKAKPTSTTLRNSMHLMTLGNSIFPTKLRSRTCNIILEKIKSGLGTKNSKKNWNIGANPPVSLLNSQCAHGMKVHHSSQPDAVKVEKLIVIL